MTEHKILDYIREMPDGVARTSELVRARGPEMRRLILDRKIRKVVVAGLGSSHTASVIASPLLRSAIGLPTQVTIATEVAFDPGLRLDPATLVVLVSRSGERGGIVEAQTAARQAGATCVAVTAVESSLLAQEADLVVLTGEGPESTYAKTKSVVASAVALMELGLGIGGGEPGADRLLTALSEMPRLLAAVIGSAEPAAGAMGEWLGSHRLALITGTAGNQGVAQEAALKFQEATGVPTEWDEAGNCLCGSVSILGPEWLFVPLVTRSDHQLSLDLLRMAQHFGADVVGVVEGELDLGPSSDRALRVPDCGQPLLAPLLFLPPVHLLMYQLALARGRDPDTPPFADAMLNAMLPEGREEPDWTSAPVSG